MDINLYKFVQVVNTIALGICDLGGTMQQLLVSKSRPNVWWTNTRHILLMENMYVIIY